MPLAMAMTEDKSHTFIKRQHRFHPTRQLVLYSIKVPEGCLHAKKLVMSKFPREQVLFSPYAPLKILDIQFSDDLRDPSGPHQVFLEACKDGKEFFLLMPAAQWM